MIILFRRSWLAVNVYTSSYRLATAIFILMSGPAGDYVRRRHDPYSVRYVQFFRIFKFIFTKNNLWDSGILSKFFSSTCICQPILIEQKSLNVNILKSKIFHEIKYDHRDHWRSISKSLILLLYIFCLKY